MTNQIIQLIAAATIGALAAFGVITADQSATLEQCAEHIANDFAPDAEITDTE